MLCPHCRSPLGLVAPLTEKVIALEAEVQRLKAQLPPEHEAEQPDPRPPITLPLPPISAPKALVAVLCAVGANLLLHVLLLFVYDLPPLVLRLSTLAAPALFCFLLYRRHDFSTGSLLASAAVVAVTSVLGMLSITAHLDMVPFWPQSPAEWRELLEYTLAIALGYSAGGFLARAIDMASRIRRSPPLLVLLLKRDESGRWNVEHLADRINQLVTSATPVVTGALGAYSGLRSLLG